MKKQNPRLPTKRIAGLFRALGQPARLRILLTIGEGEACVCHLEASLGYRQAYISQHLMALREAGILQTRREGRFIYYRLKDIQMLALIRLAGELAGVAIQYPERMSDYLPSCTCPKCEVEVREGMSQKVGG